MGERALLEFLCRQWHRSSLPSSRIEGFDYEVENGVLYGYYGSYGHDNDDPYTFDTCCFVNHQVQGMIRYILQERLAVTEEAAFQVLVQCLRKSAERAHESIWPVMLVGYPFLHVAVSLLLPDDRIPVEDSFLPLILSAAPITIPLCCIIMLLCGSRAWRIDRACRNFFGANADEVCQKLNSLKPLAAMNCIQALNRPLLFVLFVLLAWLIIAVCFLFLP